MDRETHYHSKQHSNSAKFYLILFYLGMYTIKLLLTEISVHTGNICSDIQGVWTERMDLTAFGPYALNVRTNISSYGSRARLIRAYYQLVVKCCYGINQSNHVKIIPYNSILRPV